MLKEITIFRVSLNFSVNVKCVIKNLLIYIYNNIYNTHISWKIPNISLRNISSIVNGTEN